LSDFNNGDAAPLACEPRQAAVVIKFNIVRAERVQAVWAPQILRHPYDGAGAREAAA
jgi:hypothetical protein